MLVAFYNALGGDNWLTRTNWTQAAVPISEWHGVTTDPSGRTVLQLILEENQLFGTLPPELGDLDNLIRLDLSGNQLQGEIPTELGNLSNLEWLDLSMNRLQGEIPGELGDLTYLEVLGLGDNRLDGEIPQELGDLTRLKTLHLLRNELSGEIPPELGNLVALERLFLQDNLLEGPIPQELGDLTNLVRLGLGGNTALNGCMPEGSAVAFCTAPGGFVLSRVGTRAVLSWETVEGASHYNIYYDDFWSCRTHPQYCELLVSEVYENTYTHTSANDGHFGSQYGIEACNRDGCGAWATAEDGN